MQTGATMAMRGITGPLGNLWPFSTLFYCVPHGRWFSVFLDRYEEGVRWGPDLQLNTPVLHHYHCSVSFSPLQQRLYLGPESHCACALSLVRCVCMKLYIGILVLDHLLLPAPDCQQW